MATIEDVQQLLRHLHDAQVVRSDAGDYMITYCDAQLTLRDADVDAYIEAKPRIRRPVPPAVFMPAWFEQVVDVQSNGPVSYRLFRDRDQIAMMDRGGTRHIVLSPASTLFALAQLDCDQLPTVLRRYIASFMRNRLHRGRPTPEADAPLGIDSLFSRILTIKVTTSVDDSLAGNDRKLQSVAEAALFHIAYGEGIGLSLSLSWERAYYRLGLRRDTDVQFPLRTYTSELLAYYHLAFGSDSLILAYLSLYKILEYFFTLSSDRLLHQKMTEKLVEPDFSHMKAKKLQELVRVIRQHDSKLDERRLLKTVLEHYLSTDELRMWISTFNADNDNYLTTEIAVFAERLKVDTSDDQLFATVANRIYHIRNALVHHKEGEVSRFIPFSGQEAILHRELPLLLYLAEQIIIKTGKDLQ